MVKDSGYKREDRREFNQDRKPRSVVYVERKRIIDGGASKDIFTVTRVVDVSYPLPGDILTKSQYDELVRDKRIKVIADRDGKTKSLDE